MVLFMEIAILLLLILLNGLFSMSEIALVSAKTAKLEKKASEGKGNAKIALRLREKSAHFLSAIQVGITLIGIVTGVYSGAHIADDISPLLARIPAFAPFADEIAMVGIVLIITYVSIVFGELVPKTIGLSDPEEVACAVAPFVLAISTIFFPVVKLLSGSTNMINRIMGIKQQAEQVTEEELRHLIKSASNDGIIEEKQKSIHENLFYFSDKRARHLMTHRTDVEWIDIADDLPSLIQKIRVSHHSRLICCEDGLDNVLGYISVREFLLSMDKETKSDIRSLIVKTPIVTENSEAQKVFDLLKAEHLYFCIVIDEYGGFEGIITLYDIMENILGEIPDEDDNYEPDVFVREDNTVLVSGDAPIERLTDIIEGFEIDFEEMDYSTVAGYLFHEMNKIPEIGDRLEILGYTIEVVDIDEHRIDKVLISKQEPDTTDEQDWVTL